jgi:hypothetical protein
MLESLKPKGGKRWPRGQKFQLSLRGAEAEHSYRTAVAAARGMAGRAALESQQRAWAAPLGIEPTDGLVLTELNNGQRSLSDLARILESCGVDSAEVKASVDRLVGAGIAEPIPSPAEVPQP